jgi:hypothetical protein
MSGRFRVVEINGKFYECEMPDSQYVRVMIQWGEGGIERVWIEDATPPPEAMGNPYNTEDEDLEWGED